MRLFPALLAAVLAAGSIGLIRALGKQGKRSVASLRGVTRPSEILG